MPEKEEKEKSRLTTPTTPGDEKPQKSQAPAADDGDGEPEERGMLKLLQLKLEERFGQVKTSDFSPEFLALATDAEVYRDTVFDLSRSIMKTLQHNSKTLNLKEGSEMEMASPAGGDPYELLSKAFVGIRSVLLNQKMTHVCEKAAHQMSVAHRKLQAKGRKYTHKIRTFLNVTWVDWSEEREQLMKLRQDMDLARHELSKEATGGNKKRFENADARFKAQYEKVYKLLSRLPDIKEQHRVEVIYVLHELAVYHDACAIAAQQVADLSED
ncbi:hypothetical protein L596_014358 [Steinernema carpocapsae]|uniref:BAR domain-containing protein n=2 Tax=Steinernema carpocapsae TaxID=34508 RepID=A0A4U5NBR3_STECR|nr:hypothetical protein L596_014358 [Steinernema carpocapsae]